MFPNHEYLTDILIKNVFISFFNDYAVRVLDSCDLDFYVNLAAFAPYLNLDNTPSTANN